MNNLPRFTLDKNEQKGTWDLTNDGTNRIVKSFETKQDATKRGALKEVIGPGGGSVRIEKAHGGYQEERTFPQSKDPKRSKG